MSPAARSAKVLPIDPIATPGVESVERQGAPPRVGLAEPRDALAIDEPVTSRPALARPGGAQVESPRAGDGIDQAVRALGEPHVAPADSYSLRLVSVRRLYDSGNAVSHSPSLVPLVPVARARVNAYDLDRIGAADGDPVVVRSARGTLELPCAADDTVPRGVVAVDFNLAPPPGTGPARVRNAASLLVDVDAPVVDVRLESVQGSRTRCSGSSPTATRSSGTASAGSSGSWC